jgi:hypothetical protein
VAYSAGTADKDTVAQAAAEEDEQMWQPGSDGESEVSGRAAREVWESATRTAGSRLACHPGTFERESEAAAGVHGL